MVEELKLAIKVDDDAIEQSLLKQFANAEKMANKVVLTFNNIDLDDKAIEAKFKEMQKMAGKNPIDLSIDKSSIEMLSAISKQLGNIFDIAKGKSIIDSSATAQIDKLQGKLDELTKKYDELSSKKISSTVSGKDINLVDNTEFKRLSDEFSLLKDELTGLKREMQLFEEATVSADTFVAMERNVNGLIVKVDDLIDKYVQLSVAQKNIGTDKSNISSGTHIKDVFQGDDKVTTDASTTAIKEESQALEQVSTSAKEAATSKEKFANANKEVKASAESSSTSLDEEKKKIENVGDSAEETKKKLDDVVFKPNTEGFDEIVSKLDIAKDKIEEISKITKSSVWSESQGEYLESYNIKYKNGTSEIRGESSNKKGSNVLRANEVAYDAKAEEQAAKERLKSEQKVQAQKDAFHKKNLTAIDLEIQKREEESKMVSSALKTQMEERQKQLSSMESSLKSYQDKVFNLSIKPDDAHRFPEYQTQLDSINKAIKDYETHINSLQNKGVIDPSDIDEANRLEEIIKNLLKDTKKFSSGDKGFTNIGADKVLEKINSILEQNSRMSKTAKDQIKAYYNEIYSGNPTRSLNEILDSVYKIVQQEREAGRAGKSWLEIFKDKKIYSFIGQAASMFSFYDLISLGREGFQTIRELDTALTEMKKVSDETTQSLKNYQSITFDVGDAVGATAKKIQDSTADWMRLGESINEAAESAKASNILLNVSEFESIDEATESLVAMSQAYSELGKMDIIDVLNNIGNNYSIATDGLATALQKSASALKTANNDLNSAVALATAGNAVVQDPDSVGAGIRTISLRLVGTEAAKQELESIGEETDDVITTTSKLRDTILSATAAATNDGKGFDIFDSNGNYKSTYEIMQGLADLYDDIVAKDKELGTNNLNLLLETIAGKNRSNIAASILQNGEMLRSVYQDAQNSSGSAQKELDSYLDSIDGRYFAMLYRNM